MADIEKEIKYLEQQIRIQESVHEGYIYLLMPSAKNILEILNKHLKTKVIFRQYDGSIESVCGNCECYLDKAYSRCPKCGKELDWNG